MSKTQTNERLAAHIKSLGLKNVDKYRLWCSDNGFQSSLVKTERELQSEISYSKALKLHSSLQSKLDPKKDLIKRIKDIKNNSSLFIPSEVNFLEKYSNPQEFAQVKNLVLSLAKNGIFFESVNQEVSRFGTNVKFPLHELINQLHVYSDKFHKSFLTWKPKSYNARRLAVSLLKHLFVKYEMPNFMHEIWFEKNRQLMNWSDVYFHMAQGYGIKGIDLPVPYKATKKVAHYFNTAPDDFKPAEALAWARVRALGGNSRLGNVVRQSPAIIENWKNVEFWDSVLRWFIENPMLDLAHFAPIVDYIRNRKFIAADQPNFTMKSRSADTLLKEVELWHTGLKASAKNRSWASYNVFENYKKEVGKDEHKTLWTIQEIKTEKELFQEGRAMRHCVGTYAHSCINGSVSIWSMTSKSFGQVKNELTIEVRNAEKRIVQARGFANAFPYGVAKDHMQQWAFQNGIKISTYA